MQPETPAGVTPAATSGATSLFQIHDADVVRGDRTILHVDDFRLSEGEHVALLGPNGAGKSTFIQLLTREVFPVWRPEAPVRFRGQERPLLSDIKGALGIVSSTMHEQVRVHLPAVEVVIGGLYGTLGLPLRTEVCEADRAAAMDALDRLGIVQGCFEQMIQTLGTEFDILRNVPSEDIKSCAGERIAEGIENVRTGNVKRIPGYDGEYGKIELFDEN